MEIWQWLQCDMVFGLVRSLCHCVILKTKCRKLFPTNINWLLCNQQAICKFGNNLTNSSRLLWVSHTRTHTTYTFCLNKWFISYTHFCWIWTKDIQCCFVDSGGILGGKSSKRDVCTNETQRKIRQWKQNSKSKRKFQSLPYWFEMNIRNSMKATVNWCA